MYLLKVSGVLYRLDLETVKEAKNAIAEYIEFYNHQRLHQSLGYKIPKEICLDKRDHYT